MPKSRFLFLILSLVITYAGIHIPGLLYAQVTTKWTGGGAAGDWNDAANWTIGVPGGVDHAIIDASVNDPVLTSAAVTNDLTVNGGAVLTVNGQQVSINGDLTVILSNTSGDGLILTNPADEVIVVGNAHFTTLNANGSASSVGNFSDGVLRVQGNFTQTRVGASSGLNVFVSTGTKVVLDGTSPQTMSFFEAGVANSRLHDIDVENTAGVTFNTSVFIDGQLSLADGVTLSQASNLSTYFATRLPIIAPSATYSVFNTRTSGPVVMTGAVNMPESISSLFVEQSNTLTLAGNSLEVGGGLTVTLSNTTGDGLIMTDPSDVLTVNGDALFTTESQHGSASSVGNFTDGTIRFRGNFTQTKVGASSGLSSFASTGTRAIFDGPTPQTIFSADAGLGTSHFADVDIDNASGVSFISSAAASGTVSVIDGIASSTTGTVTIDGDLVDVAGGRWQVLSTDFSGATVSLPATLTTDATFSGGGVLSNGFAITGDIIVAPDGRLELDANTVDATGDLTVTISNTPGDGLIMNHNADVLNIGGNALFTTVSQHGSAASDGNFTHGVLRVRGNFTQTKSGASAGPNVFVSTGTRVVFDGSGPQAVSFFQAGSANSRLDDVDIENTSGVTFNTSVYVMGQLTMTDGASLSQVNPLSTFFGTLMPIVPPSATYAVSNSHTIGSVVLDHSLSMVEPENNLFVEPNSTLTLDGHTMDIGGDLTVTISNTVGDGLIMTDPNDEFTVNGDALFTTVNDHGSAFSDASFTDGTLRIRGHFTQTRSGASASLNSFVSTGTRVTFDGTGTQNVFVANPGVSSSRFHDLSIENTSPSSFVLLTPMLVAGQLISPPEVRPIVVGNGMALTVNGGLDVDDLILDDVAITVNGGVIDRFNHVTFQNYSQTDVQFVINHTDMNATFVGLEFLTEPAFEEGPVGFYLSANDTDGAFPATLTLLNSNPVDGSGFTDMSGGFVVDWSSALYAVDDFVSTLEDTSVTISVLSNDMNPLSGTLTVTGSTNGANGSIVLEPGLTEITYHPDPDFNGTDTFTYTVSDGNTSDSGLVTVTVVSDQDPILQADPIALAFGPAALGSSVIRSLIVKNIGTDALHVTDINHTVLAVTDTMFSLAPGDSLEVEVTFSPGSIGPLDGDIEILSNDPAAPTFLVAVTGAGTPVGDVTGDEIVNILDIISLVNVLIGEQDAPDPGSSAYLRLDINGDGDLNVLDVVTLINIILDEPLMKVVAAPLGPVSLEIGPGTSPQDHLVQLPLHFVNDGPIAGLQFSLRYDKSLIQFGSPEPAERLQDMQWTYQNLGGLLHFIIYSTEGGHVDAGTGPLFYLPVSQQSDGADAEVSIENVVAADQSGHSVSVLQTGAHRLASLPATFELKPNRPNPFNPTTSISYDVPKQTRIRITVYNLLGQTVTRIVDEVQPPGRYTAVWNGHNSEGHQVASGVYIYRMSSGTGYTQSRRMLLLK